MVAKEVLDFFCQDALVCCLLMSKLDELRGRLADVNALESAAAIMDWDQQTYMPAGGAEARANHVGTLVRMAHEIFTDDKTVSALESAKSEASDEDEVALLRVVERELKLATKLPAELVGRKSKLSATAHEDWVKARKENNFKGFAPILEQMFDICKEEATYLGYTDHIYDALTDMYEEGASAASWHKMFDSVREPQVKLIQQIKECPVIDDSKLYGDWDTDKQSKFTLGMVEKIGFDLSRGRQDVAPHPFCTGWSVGDIRLTTRYKPYIGSAIFGSLHEAGHGMYEQGSPAKWDRTRLAGGVSLGLHESQSRTWENIVGRSQEFWVFWLPRLQAEFPALGGISVADFYRQINKVNPSLIRVEADELTYNLHVMVRFEIECAVLSGELAVKDLPHAWNSKYEQYLGLTPDSDANGCLQDVHWSMGSIGYFPTYSMGNILSGQIWNSLQKDIPNPHAEFANGKFDKVFEWLREKIYAQGKKYSPKDLVKRVTGEDMNASYYLAMLEKKYKGIYNLQ
jgi:carboxypeptidase Taq